MALRDLQVRVRNADGEEWWAECDAILVEPAGRYALMLRAGEHVPPSDREPSSDSLRLTRVLRRYL